MFRRSSKLLGHFEKRAPSYGTYVLTYTDEQLAQMCWEVLPRQEYIAVLDLAAGQGDFYSLLFAGSPQADVLFVDISKAMLAEGAKRGNIPPNRAIVANVEKGLPFLDSAFDLVLCRYAWHDFRKQEKVMCEINRVLKPNGRFLFVDMSLPDTVDWQILRAYRKLHSLKTGNPSYIITLGQLNKLARHAGFHITKFRWYCSFVALSHWHKENQIDDAQRERIVAYVLNNARAQYFVRSVKEQEKDIEFAFPVLIALLEKQ